MQFRPLAAALLCATPLLHAEETTEPVVVTASRMAETADASLAPVTVITRTEIEQSQAPTVLELLRLQTGVDVARTGGPGGETSVFLRGTNSNHVLVLIDGVRAGSATSGAFAWQNLDPAQIERIEIVRGPRSTLYGSDAIGGVIQIFTRKPAGLTLRAATSTYESHDWQAGYGSGNGPVHYHLLASGADSRGFDATTPNAATTFFTPNPDRDGFDKSSVSGSLSAPVGAADVGVNVWRNTGHVSYDNGTQESINQALDLRLSGEVAAGWLQSLRIGAAVDDLDDHSATPGRFITTRRSADWQHTFSAGEQRTLVVGFDWTQDRGEDRDFSGYSPGYDHRVTDRGAYVNLELPLGLAQFQAGLRHDDNDTFGNQSTGQAALGFDLADNLRLLASCGSAFKAPALNDLYYPVYGNPDLKPERSTSGEIDLRYRVAPRQHVNLNFFQTNVQDLIVWDLTTFHPSNVNKARIQGMELEYAAGAGPWTAAANLTLQEARDVATDKPLLRRPDRKLALTGSRQLESGDRLRAEFLLVGNRRDSHEGADKTLPGYGLVNVAAIHPLAPRWRMEGRIDDLFAQHYVEAYGFRTPGRVFTLAVAYGF